MARKSKSLAGAFNKFEGPEQESVNENGKQEPNQKTVDVKELQKQEPVQENGTGNSNSEPVTKDVTQERNTDTSSEHGNGNVKTKAKQESVSELQNQETSNRTIKDVRNNIMSMYDEKSKKKTVEETHNRATFLFRKDLQDRLDKLAEGKRGFKTMFLNQAVEALLDEMEDQE